MQTKTCSTCKENLPIDSFYADKSKSSGFKSSCKACVIKKKSIALKKKKNKEKPKIIPKRRTKAEIESQENNETRVCKKCNQDLPVSKFYAAKNRTVYTCIPCQKVERKSRYEETRDEEDSNLEYQTERLAQALQAFGQIKTGIRKCSECRRWRDQSEFRLRRSAIAGVSNKCNSCIKVESHDDNISDMALQIKKNKEERMERIIKRTLKNKGLIK